VNSVGGEVGALLDCNFLLAAPTFRVGGGIWGLLELLLLKYSSTYCDEGIKH
jgi:hypothetical protein